MVFIFFCVSGVLGSMSRHPSLTTREAEPQATRPLATDTSLIAATLTGYPGAVVVIANDWPFFYDLNSLREAGREFERRIVNVVRTLSDSKESAVLDFMNGRAEPFIVIASQDFEFTEKTAGKCIHIDDKHGFNDVAHGRLQEQLRAFGERALRPLSEDEIMRASISTRDLRRAQKLFLPTCSSNDRTFRRELRSRLMRRSQ